MKVSFWLSTLVLDQMMQLNSLWTLILCLIVPVRAFRTRLVSHGLGVGPSDSELFRVRMSPLDSGLQGHDVQSMFSSIELAANSLQSSVNVEKILESAFEKGKSGATAASVQVLTLMWLRTTLNYQYRFGTDTKTALNTLWEEGGIQRLYQGLPFAILQGPLSRFGDTAANALILSYISAVDPTGTIPLFVRTAAGSVSAGAWRLVILPIDTVKTTLQVNGKDGFQMIREKIASEGPSVLYNGAIASVLATIVGHYPWFFTYNSLSDVLPTAQELHQMASTDPDTLYAMLGQVDERLLSLLRGAIIGVAASSASDICSNSLRVLKTVRQTSVDSSEEGKNFSYISAAKEIVEAEGWNGLLGRGLQTRLLANAVQGALFSVLYKFFSASR